MVLSISCCSIVLLKSKLLSILCFRIQFLLLIDILDWEDFIWSLYRCSMPSIIFSIFLKLREAFNLLSIYFSDLSLHLKSSDSFWRESTGNGRAFLAGSFIILWLIVNFITFLRSIVLGYPSISNYKIIIHII